MVRRRERTRLLWFKLWVDDFLGGVSHLQDSELGQYMRLLLAQWSSGGVGVLAEDAEDYCKGPLSPRVRRKFEEREGGKYLVNRRLEGEWLAAQKESTSKSEARRGQDSTPDSFQREGKIPAKKPEARYQKPEAQTPEARANPLAAGRRPQLESELLHLAESIGERESLDPTEVMAQCSDFKGHSQLNPAAMSDDRLLHTLRAARKRAGNGEAVVNVQTPGKVRAVALDLRRRAGWFDSEQLGRPVEEFMEQAEAMLKERVR